MLRANAITNRSLALKPSRFPGLHLSETDVHLWQANLDNHTAEIFESFLSEDELARANRFHFTNDRKHFVVARGILRNLLAAYLGVNCTALQFCYGAQGKPFVLQDDEQQINFNVSHSHGRAVFVFSRGREVGVDIEFIKEDFEADEIAQQFFSRNEMASLRIVNAETKNRAFFDCWTRKEAYIKARGEGLSMPLDEFDVSLIPGDPAALVNNYRDEREVSRWSMQAITAPEGYVGALVVEGHDWQLKSFCFGISNGAKSASAHASAPNRAHMSLR